MGVSEGKVFFAGHAIKPEASLKHSKHKNLPNFGEATVTLYHGGQPSKNGFRTLAKMEVNTPRDAVRGATLGVFVSKR